MSKIKGIKKWLLIIAAVVVVVLIGMGGITMFKNYVSIRGQHLNSYEYSSGGGMTGGYHSETVKRDGNQALISIETAKWHSQDPVVKEYLVDVAILDELEAIVRKHRMNFWNRKKFTNMFVADGETESYDFDFDENSISFSSQIYPLGYGKKLAELDKVVDKYVETAVKLPGLVNEKVDDEEFYFLPEGELEIYVFSYAENRLGLRILNGTDEEVEIPESYKIINVDTGVTLVEEETPNGGIFYEQTRDEEFIRLKERLSEGNYMMIYGDYEIPFEIR